MGRSEISSMLFRPIIRWPFQSIDEYRDETLMIGSPIVFQTAPPQPASNARITCSPQLVGGAEASQNGFGEKILPANSTEMSGMAIESDMGLLQELHQGQRCAFSVRDGINHFPATIHAVAARKIFWVRGLPRRAVHNDTPVFHANTAASLQKFGQRRLADGWDHHVAGNLKLRARNLR